MGFCLGNALSLPLQSSITTTTTGTSLLLKPNTTVCFGPSNNAFCDLLYSTPCTTQVTGVNMAEGAGGPVKFSKEVVLSTDKYEIV